MHLATLRCQKNRPSGNWKIDLVKRGTCNQRATLKAQLEVLNLDKERSWGTAVKHLAFLGCNKY